MGLALTSILDVDTAGKSAPERGVDLGWLSDLTGAGFTVVSDETVRAGIFRIVLYLDCCLAKGMLAIIRRLKSQEAYGGGSGLEPSFRSTIMSIS